MNGWEFASHYPGWATIMLFVAGNVITTLYSTTVRAIRPSSFAKTLHSTDSPSTLITGDVNLVSIKNNLDKPKSTDVASDEPTKSPEN